MNISTLGSFEMSRRCFVATHRNLQLAVDLAVQQLIIPCLEHVIPDLYSKIELHINTVNTSSSLCLKLGKLFLPKHLQFLPFKNHIQNGCVVVALIKWCRIQSHRAKPLLSIVSNDLDVTVVYVGLVVGVSDGDVERKVVVESAVCVGEFEFG
jgi:hypothetical protein